VDLLLVFQGEHGLLPGAWQGGDGAAVGTWNFEAVDVHGRPRVLDRAASLELLRRTFEHLEARRARPTPWSRVERTAERLVEGTCCVRVPAERVVAKAKLGPGKPDDVRARLIAGLERPGPYRQPSLARRMRAALRYE
jgi:transcriptional regulator